jgi:hypothetical protein
MLRDQTLSFARISILAFSDQFSASFMSCTTSSLHMSHELGKMSALSQITSPPKELQPQIEYSHGFLSLSPALSSKLEHGRKAFSLDAIILAFGSTICKNGCHA